MLYTPSRLAAITSEAAKPDSIFSLGDRMGLLHDAVALGKAGYLSLSSALNLVYELRAEKECELSVYSSWCCTTLTHGPKVLVWDSIDASLTEITQTWWEDDKITRQLNAFRRVRWSLLFALILYLSRIRPTFHLTIRHCTRLWWNGTV